MPSLTHFDNGCCAPCEPERTETLTELLENNGKQIYVMIDRANCIKEKIVGTSPACCDPNSKREGHNGIVGVYRQAQENTEILAQLYEILLQIDSQL